jgi:hypothetical protein
MSDYDSLIKTIGALAGEMKDLQRQAAGHYAPVVDELLKASSRDTQSIEHTLDRLLDFCGYEPVLELFKRLCRHFWTIDPEATAHYINAYQEYWDCPEKVVQAQCTHEEDSVDSLAIERQAVEPLDGLLNGAKV